MKIRKIMPLVFAVIMQIMAIMLFMDNYIFLGVMVQLVATILSIATGIFIMEESWLAQYWLISLLDYSLDYFGFQLYWAGKNQSKNLFHGGNHEKNTRKTYVAQSQTIIPQKAGQGMPRFWFLWRISMVSKEKISKSP